MEILMNVLLLIVLVCAFVLNVLMLEDMIKSRKMRKQIEKKINDLNDLHDHFQKEVVVREIIGPQPDPKKIN